MIMHQIIRKAFTLIELLVVIAIIGILSGLIVVTMNGVTAKANIAKSQVFSNSLRDALMLNLVAEFKLDEGSGSSAVDNWGNRTGTLSGFDSTAAKAGDTSSSGWMGSSNCVSGTCLRFDGVNDYVATGFSYPSVTKMTIEGWFYPTSYSNINTSSAIAGVNSYYYFWQYYDAYPRSWVIEVYNDGTRRFSDISLDLVPLNTWSHIVLTYDGNAISAYRNGVVYSTKTVGAVTIPALSSGTFRVGAPGYFGAIDGVRFYDSSVPTSKIKENYYAGLNGLLANGSISPKEYLSRIAADFAKN